LADDATLSGSVALAFAGSSFAMTVVSGGAANGRASYNVVCGRGGWGSELPAKAYLDDAGVKVSTIASDAASAAGEVLGTLPPTRLGPHFARAVGPASRVLHEVAPRAWYIDEAGVTQFGARATTTYSGNAARSHVDPGAGVIELATEDVTGLVPGVQVDGSLPATDVEYILDDKRLTVRIYSGPRSSRRLDAYRRIFDALDPRRLYRGAFEFRVVTQSGDRLNLQAVRASSGLPDLERVPIAPGMAGLRADVALGSIVKVAFADADPSRPFIFAFAPPDEPGWMPLFLELGEVPTLGVARQTDPVVAGPFAGTITLASARVKAGL
jgi:hypothetical protein